MDAFTAAVARSRLFLSLAMSSLPRPLPFLPGLAEVPLKFDVALVASSSAFFACGSLAIAASRVY